MNLLIITDYWINSDGGGVREYTKNLVGALKSENIIVKVLFRRGFDTENYKLHFNKLQFIIDAFKILNKEAPDVILCQGGWFGIIPALIYKIKCKNVKTLYLFHTHIDKKFHFIIKIFLENLLNSFDHVGFVSNSLCNEIINEIGLNIKSKTFVLYAGVERKDPKDEELAEFKLNYNLSNKFILLGQALTANYGKKEGAKLLISTLKDIIKKYPNVRLMLTRKGIYENELKSYADSLGLSEYVIFTGDLKNPNIATAICDIYTHITYGEGGLSLSVLEAMSFGKAIIASDIGGIPEALSNKQSGLLVSNDINSIYNSIVLLIEDKTFANTLGNNANNSVKHKFTWKKTVSNLMFQLNS